MPIEILMPELGESVHEGTVSRWLKQVGDPVKMDEPIVEIMTDKVNTELPSPASGILVKVLIEEGDPVEVFAPMGLIEEDIELAKKQLAEGSAPSISGVPRPEPPRAAQSGPVVVRSEPGERRFLTPVVRAMMQEHGITEDDLETIEGTGQGGRVTKRDLNAYLASKPVEAPAPAKPAVESQAPRLQAPRPPEPIAPLEPGTGQSLVKLPAMRKMIADAMTRASQVPVVSTLVELDVSTLVDFRARNKSSFEAQHGVKLTYTPFFIKALADTLAEFDVLNSFYQEGGQMLKNESVHLGVAVSLGEDGSGGLIVPVIRDCQTKDLVQISRELDEIAKKARANSLGVADVQGGTFTLTNPGSYGAVQGTPMIAAPQSGILGTYGIIKRPVVIQDMIAIRPVMNVVLTYDHRLVDGLTAGRFLQAFKKRVEGFSFFR